MATLSAARYLAVCLKLKMDGLEEPDPGLLVKAIEVQTAGLCEVYAGQRAINDLRALHSLLQGKLDREIDD